MVSFLPSFLFFFVPPLYPSCILSHPSPCPLSVSVHFVMWSQKTRTHQVGRTQVCPFFFFTFFLSWPGFLFFCPFIHSLHLTSLSSTSLLPLIPVVSAFLYSLGSTLLQPLSSLLCRHRFFAICHLYFFGVEYVNAYNSWKHGHSHIIRLLCRHSVCNTNKETFCQNVTAFSLQRPLASWPHILEFSNFKAFFIFSPYISWNKKWQWGLKADMFRVCGQIYT